MRSSVLPRHLATTAAPGASRFGAACHALRTRTAGRRRAILFALALFCAGVLVVVPMLSSLSDAPAGDGRTGDDGVFSDGTERGTGGQGGPVIGTRSGPTSSTTAPGGAIDPATGVPVGGLTGVGGDVALPGAGAAAPGSGTAGTAGAAGGGTAGSGGAAGGGTGTGGAAVAGSGTAGSGTAAGGGTRTGTTSGGSPGGTTGSTSGGTSSGSGTSSTRPNTSTSTNTSPPKTTTGTKTDSDSDSDPCPCKDLSEKVNETTETLTETVEGAEDALPSLP